MEGTWYFLSFLDVWFTGKESACQRRRCRFDPWVREDPLEKEMATQSSSLAWRVPWAEEPGGLPSPVAESETTERLSTCACTVFHDAIPFLVKWRKIPQGEATTYVQTLFFFFKVNFRKIFKNPSKPYKTLSFMFLLGFINFVHQMKENWSLCCI